MTFKGNFGNHGDNTSKNTAYITRKTVLQNKHWKCLLYLKTLLQQRCRRVQDKASMPLKQT